MTSDKIHILEQTKGQADSDVWIAEQRKRLTASAVGGIVKMRSTCIIKKAKKVQNLFYSKFKGNAATRPSIRRSS